MNLDSIRTIAVVGAGTMGQGIAQVCASAGYQVLLYDMETSLTNKAMGQIRKSLDMAVEKGKMTPAEKDETAGRITLTNDLTKVIAGLIIEAVIERLDVKQKIFAALENINDPQSVFTTNTSSIPVTQIAAVLKKPERFAGFHFFNPAPIMKLVEVISGVATQPDVLLLLKAFSERLDKVAVVVKDSPGFIVNRIARHYYVESLTLLEEGVTDVQSIDKLLKSSGFKMGAFELMDLIGIDTNFSVTTSMYHAFHQDPKFRPSRLQQQKIDAGHLGRKSGKGFYDYPN